MLTSNLLAHCSLTRIVSLNVCAIACTVAEVASGIVKSSGKWYPTVQWQVAW